MKLKIYKNFIFDILISLFFYFQILVVNARTDIFFWILNSAILFLTFTLIKSKLKVQVTKMWLFHIFIAFWVVTDILLIVSDFFNIGFNNFALGNFFVIALQLPILAIIFYYFLCNYKSYFTFSFVSFVITFFLFYGWKLSFFPDWKYQIIGNMALFSFILFQQSGVLKSYLKSRLIIYLILFFIILIVGSRQSLLGLLIICYFIVLSRLKVNFLKTSISILLISLALYFFFPSNLVMEQSFSQFNTINRVVANSSLENSADNYRLRSAEMLIDNFSYLPNGYAYTLDKYFLEPHNLFLEIIYLKGYIFGGILVLFLFWCVLQSMFLSNQNKIIRMLIISLLIPALVSYGLHAARFFIISILVYLIIKSVGLNQKVNINRG
jgi:hypothetical protein